MSGCDLLEQWAWETDTELPVGMEVSLTLGFHGNITDDFAGLYRSSVRTPDGTLENAAVTQFEATDARAMFPCFDEPLWKAKFKVSVVRRKEHMPWRICPYWKVSQWRATPNL